VGEALQEQPEPTSRETNGKVITFIILLCFICSFLLAVVSYALSTPQKIAKEFDQSKQMLIAAKILDAKGVFQILQENGELIDAEYDAQKKILTPVSIGKNPKIATVDEIKEIAASRIRALLTDASGKTYTLQEKNVDLLTYLSENKKVGYAALKYKLIYAILPNDAKNSDVTPESVAQDLSKAESFVVPVSGFGLWAPIYGYIAVYRDGDKVIGTTWYEHGETPGLGANITEPWWQNQFYDKLIFQESGGGKTDFQTAPMGILVVKGKVQDVYGEGPKSKSAVDGMSGATLTGDGVTMAYRNSLTPYRQFFIHLKEGKKN
jgi:Na+-transporting NADH:ubiquinone oxidoreductase subunit C